jgi:putative ABC transport system permease protein
MIAPPPDSKMLQPTLLEGRWLLEDDENAVVMNTDLLDDEPDLQVGDTIVLDVDDKEVKWTIVGLVRSVMAGPFVYANFPYFSEVTRSTNAANSLNIALDDQSRQSQIAMTSALEQHFEDNGVRVSAAESTVIRTERVASQYGVLIMFLAIMALTLALVGGLGLMGSMSINVLERRREIGVMRSIGASTNAIMQIVIVEGVIIGVISWTVGAIMAIPLGKALSDAVGAGFIHSDLTYTYSFQGAATWLAVVIGIAAFASFVPAKSASGLSVREVLAYE